MKVLLVTEKCGPDNTQRDGGARLVTTIQRAFGDLLSIMQFGSQADASATWHFKYPINLTNRFEMRIANANFIAKQVNVVVHRFTHVIFIHASMQFGLITLPLRKGIHIWTFPMFLTPSYVAAGEIVPERYVELERITLSNSNNILTPSYLEKWQLIEFYSIAAERIHVVPRGIETQLLAPKTRTFSGMLKICNVGSIKPQKNTIGLVRLFANIRDKFPRATLKIIGPVQDTEYHKEVCAEIKRLGIHKFVELVGYVVPNKISFAIQDTNLHISTSTCETFGRSIFETLALGIPNIAMIAGNAAAEFLQHLPYARFVDDVNEVPNVIEEVLTNLPMLSSMALEIGRLYDDKILSKLLAAKICNKEFIAISDFDGTLFHKGNTKKTKKCIQTFKEFPIRVICSARPIEYLLDKLSLYDLQVDWIIGCSGSIVTNGNGKPLWHVPLNFNDLDRLKMLVSKPRYIESDGKVLQVATPVKVLTDIFGLRIEIYQDISFIAHWEASKLHAIHRLLRYINWSGQVSVFGDGLYDTEMLTYFDGSLITANNYIKSQQSEHKNA